MRNEQILIDIKTLIVSKMGNIIERIILFGSQVHDGNEKYSDYDVLIILNTDYTWKHEWNIYDLCYEVCLKYDIIIDTKIISLSELDSPRGRQPYIQNALEMGISA